jgi:hypothetical protein
MDPQRILGGSPISVIIKLVLMSIVVGIVLSALGLTPAELFYRIDLLLRRLYDLGFGWVEWLFRYFLVGAVIVIPIWLIARLISSMKKRDGS